MARDPAKLVAAIEEMENELAEKLAEVVEIKMAINVLCRRAGRPEPYKDADAPIASGPKIVQPDQYANFDAPSVAARAYLKDRGRSAPVEEVYYALKKGGFHFASRDDDKNLIGVRVAIGKDRKLVRFAESDHLGLEEWYPNRRKEKDRKSDKDDDGTDTGNGATETTASETTTSETDKEETNTETT